jgi:hypothetical protein
MKVWPPGYCPKGGSAFKSFSTNVKNDKSGDAQLMAMIEKALGTDSERQKSMGYDIQRHLAKAMWVQRRPGYASGYSMAWPALGNYKGVQETRACWTTKMVAGPNLGALCVTVGEAKRRSKVGKRFAFHKIGRANVDLTGKRDAAWHC